MRAFHNDATIKAKYLDRVRRHAAADEIQKGFSWIDGRGNAVGCTIHSDDWAEYEQQLGIPRWLAALEDTIFEGLPLDLARLWPERLLTAIAVGQDVDDIKAPFLAFVVAYARSSVARASATPAWAALQAAQAAAQAETAAAQAETAALARAQAVTDAWAWASPWEAAAPVEAEAVPAAWALAEAKAAADAAAAPVETAAEAEAVAVSAAAWKAAWSARAAEVTLAQAARPQAKAWEDAWEDAWVLFADTLIDFVRVRKPRRRRTEDSN